MLSEKIISMTNEQIKKEFYSAYLYLAIANFYEENGLCGFANWFIIQAEEEEKHAMKFCKYLHDNNAKVTLYSISAPNIKFDEFEDPLELSYRHEKEVTASINSIYAQADSEKDYRTKNFLQWFIEEQFEEEVSVKNFYDKVCFFGSTPEGLYKLDKEFGKREN